MSTPSDLEVAVTRRFEAPAALLWETFTTPRFVLRWWGPSFAPLTDCEIDLRVGGAWRYVLAHEGGAEIVFSGTYLEIDPLRRIVSTESIAGMPAR